MDLVSRAPRSGPGSGPSLQPARDDELVRILETMPAAFCFLDRNWCFRRLNAMAEQLLGCARDDVLGRSVWEVLPGLVGTTYEHAYRDAVGTGRPVSFEAPAITGSGGWYEVRAWPGPDGLAVYSLDVSQRRRAQEAAQRATARMGLLADVSTDLSGARDGRSALGRLARLVVPTLADACIVTVVDREGRARDVASWHADPARQALLERYTAVRLDSLPASSPVGRALQGDGSPVIERISSILPLMRPGPARDLLGSLGTELAVVLPLTADDRTLGVLTLYQDPGRAVGGDDLATAREVAAQAARAIDRVHRQSQQAKLAEGLQRSLLTDPPAIPGTEVAVRYVPAAEAARVGGDWYDAFLQRSGEPVVVIGDVVGHDTAAAAVMGQLRGLLRGIAHHSGAGPAEILRGLDEAITGMHAGTLATAAVARLERVPPSAGRGARARLRWTNAGHPPPALVADDGGVELLMGERFDLMLGVDHEAKRAENVIPLAPGDTVVLYTDGLIERRGSTVDDGLDRLRGHLTELAGRPLDLLSDELLDRMLAGTPGDDVALVALALRRPDGGRCERLTR
ncbi:MAG: putative sensor protein [Frankiales bacterium]|nr:putative sensor protein [Frankiales bacterium]